MLQRHCIISNNFWIYILHAGWWYERFQPMNVGGVAIKGHDSQSVNSPWLSGARKHSTGQCRGDSWGVVIFRDIWDLFISMIYFVDFFKQAQDDYFEYWTATVHLTIHSSAEAYCTWKCWNFSMSQRRRPWQCDEWGMPQNSLDFFMLCWTCHFVLLHHQWWSNGVKFEQTWQESSEQKNRIDPKPVWIPWENQPYQLLHRNMSKILSIFV